MSAKPLLIFDGDCGFCRRWIQRWCAITGDRVEYEPYQKVGSSYPQISEENFKRSVQLIEDSAGACTITSGAEAVFRSLAYNPRRRWFLWLYEKILPVRVASEAFYRLIAQNRSLFSKLSHFFWGDQLEPSTYRLSTFFFLRILAVIYFIAFFSLGIQILGLIGSQGILPISMYLEQVREQIGARGYGIVPTLTWINSGDGFLLFLCGGGILFSVLLFWGFIPNVLLFLLWGFYLSLVTAGQEFLSFQWDILLLETGFLAIFLAPMTLRDHFSRNFEPPAIPRLLLKWLLFRLVFLSGVVKLASGDETWRTLTALQFHYETQPLPPWTAWAMHHLPPVFHQFSTLMMFLSELVIPFLFFAPRRLRLTGCFAAIFFQLLIVATGNYCFFNLLAMALCLFLLDDAFWMGCHPARSEGSQILQILRRYAPQGDKKARKMPAGITLPLAFLVLWISLGQMSWIWEGGKRQVRSQGNLEQILSPFRTINSYGLFAVMTTTRDEIRVEGSNDGVNWLAYEFKYKPGDLSKKPRFVQPHQPRLDWQMWFAALGTYRQNPWFMNFCIRLLQGSPEVLKLIEKNPFPKAPPRYIRASLYRYRFSNFEEKRHFKVWWKREERGLYCPPLSLSAS